MIILKNLLQPLIPAPVTWKLQLLSNWQTIVGNLKTTVTLEKIYEDTLILGVDNSSWMHELYLLSPLLITTINTYLDQPRIKKIRFKLIGRSKKKVTSYHKQIRAQSTVSNITKQEQQALANISDELLRKALYQFLMRCYQERE